MKKHTLLLALVFCGLFASSVSYGQSELDAAIMLEDLRKLSHDKAEGRKTGSAGAESARRFIIRQMEDVKAKSLQKGFRHPFGFANSKGDTIQGENVLAYIKGDQETAIVISAHYDHLGIINGEVFNGADDNASGVAAMLAMMEYFKRYKPRHTMIFAAFDGEEMGLQGAKAFLKDPSVPVDDIILNVNMDMISMNDKNELYVAGTHHNPNLKCIIEKVDVAPLKLLFGHDSPDLGKDDWTYSSDHGPFHSSGIPFLYFGVEDHSNYHKSTDDYENVNKSFYVRAAHAILYSILALDKSIN
jgi:Zn-dependent M28 family amino/carboxypeptidase